MKEVLDLIQNGKLTGDIEDWYGFLGFCDFHRLTGFLADKLTALPDVPQQVKRHARIQKAYQAYKQASLTRAAKELEEGLITSGLRHAFLKGAVLCGHIYESGERCGNDIDLLISGRDVGKAAELLRELGYAQGIYQNGKIVPFSRAEIIKRRMNRGETAPFVRLESDAVAPFTEIDLNFSLSWVPNDEKNLTESFLNNTVIAENGLRALDTEHTLIYLCAHLYKEAVILSMVKRLKDIELYKYADIFKIIKLTDGERFWRLVEAYGLNGECGYALYNANLLFPSLKLNIDKPSSAERVFDPENKDKEYVWEIPLLKRLGDTGRLRFLKAKR